MINVEWVCPDCTNKVFAQCSCGNRICTMCGYIDKRA